MKEVIIAGMPYLEIGIGLMPTTQHKIRISQEDYDLLKEKYIKNDIIPEKLPILLNTGDSLAINDVIITINKIIDYLDKKL